MGPRPPPPPAPLRSARGPAGVSGREMRRTMLGAHVWDLRSSATGGCHRGRVVVGGSEEFRKEVGRGPGSALGRGGKEGGGPAVIVRVDELDKVFRLRGE